MDYDLITDLSNASSAAVRSINSEMPPTAVKYNLFVVTPKSMDLSESSLECPVYLQSAVLIESYAFYITL